jgi:predicted RNase H-like HicB family nuclease
VREPLTTAEYLAIPFIMTMEPAVGPDGHWLCRAEYPELPDCVGEALSPIDAIERLERVRRRYILEQLERGETVPVPRSPLRYQVALMNETGNGFSNEPLDR